MYFLYEKNMYSIFILLFYVIKSIYCIENDDNKDDITFLNSKSRFKRDFENIYSTPPVYSYNDIFLLKSPSKFTYNTVHNMSFVDQINFKLFLEKAIHCPKSGQFEIVSDLECPRRLFYNSYTYVCCEKYGNIFKSLNIFPLTMRLSEAQYLYSVIDMKIRNRLNRGGRNVNINSIKNEGLLIVHMYDVKNRYFSYNINTQELQQLRDFFNMSLQCPDFIGQLTGNPTCYRAIRFYQFITCCNVDNKVTNFRFHTVHMNAIDISFLESILYEQEWTDLSLDLQDDEYLKFTD